ncbi:MAG: hypothetical protein COS71_04225, partial [Candidatus Moranbacteria bacterium CG06_land_8_20_14_3_00_40_12]
FCEKQKGGSGAIHSLYFSLFILLAVLAPKSRPCADGKMELPNICRMMNNLLNYRCRIQINRILQYMQK